MVLRERTLVSTGIRRSRSARLGPGGFSWANGSRLYYANLTSNVTAASVSRRSRDSRRSPSHARQRPPRPQGDKSAWMEPVLVSKQSSATFADKEQLWADNAASSQLFGNVYICYASFTGNGAAPMVVASSRTAATRGRRGTSARRTTSLRNSGDSRAARSGRLHRRRLRSAGGVPEPVQVPAAGGDHVLAKSFDGGELDAAAWSFAVTDPCYVSTR